MNLLSTSETGISVYGDFLQFFFLVQTKSYDL